MKNKKLITVFTLIVALLLIMVTYVQASDSDLPILNIDDGTGTNNEASNNTGNVTGNNTNTTNTTNNRNTTNTANTANTNTLPQTGIESDVTILLFIVVCIASAIYAFIKIKNYKNI